MRRGAFVLIATLSIFVCAGLNGGGAAAGGMPSQVVIPLGSWAQESPATSPSPRSGAAMAFNPATGRVVLFGGLSRSGPVASASLSDTWSWDGFTATWTQLHPATSPPARTGAGLAYDSVSNALILFGGTNCQNGGCPPAMQDTWLWDGSTWTELSPTTSPPARTEASMAEDLATGTIVLFGGNDGSGNVLGDTWTWDGNTWTQQSPYLSPPARYEASMAYNEYTGLVVLFGGQSNGIGLAGTWTWDGANWRQADAGGSSGPPGRFRAAMAYDPILASMVLFGGNDGSGNLADTWIWDGSNWTQQSPPVSPPAVAGAAMATNDATNTVLLFGGDTSGAAQSGDTWSWIGKLPPGQPG